MRTSSFVRVMVTGFLLVGLMEGAALAQPFDKRTHFTFSGPVTVPGVTLPAGSYEFRVAEMTSRNVIQVLSGDGQRSYAMFFGLRAERNDFPEETELRFMETAAGHAPAIESWWYPGTKAGYEFVYPKAQARLLAKAATRPVLTTAEETTTPIETGANELARVAPEAEAAPATPAAVQTGEIVAEPAVEPALPKTASNLPLLGFGAAMFLLGAALIRGWRVVVG